jgi:hypothetical protein
MLEMIDGVYRYVGKSGRTAESTGKYGDGVMSRGGSSGETGKVGYARSVQF